MTSKLKGVKPETYLVVAAALNFGAALIQLVADIVT
jgi:hypothetical protein